MANLNDLIIKDLDEEDIPGALRISKKELGIDYLSESDFIDYMNKKDGNFCKVALHESRVVGFFVCRIFGPDKVDECLKLPDSKERDKIMSVKRIGLLDSASTDNDVKGLGIGTRLSEASLEMMYENGVDAICAMAWKSIHGTTNVKKILERIGLEETMSIQGYWNNMVDSPEGHHCPDCKEPPCKCYGVFYVKYLC